MILLPIGHEETSVRRLPLVTFAIMALCLVAFLASGQGTIVSTADIELEDKALDAIEYYWEHPYLDLDDDFEKLIYGEADGVEEDFEEVSAALGEFTEFGKPPRSTSRIAEEQAELDRLTVAALDARDRHTFFRWGLIPADVTVFGVISHMFMHGGWLHLIGNLLILYLAGPFVEDIWGRPLFAAFYFLSGVAAAAAHIAFNTGSEVPMIGASGAIAGVMGAFLLHYQKTKIKFFFMIGFFIRGTFDAAAWIMLPLWFGEQLMLALWLGGDLAGVAYWAHVGGFGFGLAAAFGIKRAGILERYVQPKLVQATAQSVVERPDLEFALIAREEGRHEDAYDLLNGELQREPANVDTAELLWETAAGLGRQAETVPLIMHSMQARMRGGQTESLASMWQRVAEVDPTVQADTAFLLRMVRIQVEASDREGARATLRRALLAVGGAPAPALALKIARLAGELDPAIARGALRALMRRQDIGAEDRQAAEQLLAGIASQLAVQPAPRPAAAAAVPAAAAVAAVPAVQAQPVGGNDDLPLAIPLSPQEEPDD